MDSALLPSPIGPLYVEAENGRLTRLYTDGHRFHAHAEPDRDGRFADLQAQLDEYFAGERTTFDVPLAEHGTDFELRVWQRLREIPYGETCTYGEIARELGSSRARGRPRERPQPDLDHRPLPPRDRGERQPDGLRRRAGGQARPARP